MELDKVLENLNQKQQEAVSCDLGPTLVIAGAGSGKTRVLTNRFQYVSIKYNWKPDEILAITFTNKAANEMKSRLMNNLSQKHFNWVGTFHSICLKILREDISHLDRKNDFSIIDDDDQISIFKEAYKINNIDPKDIPFKQIFSLLDKVKRNDLTNEDIKNQKSWEYLNIKNLKDQVSKSAVLKYYAKYCEQNNLLDFNERLKLTNQLLQNDDIRNKWASKFKYILVDEFQDTNNEQYELIKKLSSIHKNIFVVGDPDQMIYTWRGAEQSIINNFPKEFKDTKIIILDINYRSSQEILDASNSLITFNKNRIEKSLVSKEGYTNKKPIYFFANNHDDESKWVANKINHLIDSGVNTKDIAILYRSNYLSRNIEHALISNQIKYKIFGGLKFYQRKEIKDLLAYLKSIYLADELSTKRIINTPRRGISQNTIDIINQYAIENHITFPRALFCLENIESISKQAVNGIKDFVNLVSSIDTNRSLTNVFDEVLEKTKYIEYLQDNEESAKIPNIDELRASILQYEKDHPNCTFIDYLQDISLLTDSDEKYEDAVALMTIHVSKGLEFDYVFVISMNEDIFPSKQSTKTTEGIEEERRIAYVALTRAKKELYISCHGGVNYMYNTINQPSRFIEEIGKDLLIREREKVVAINRTGNEWYDSTAMSKPINTKDNYLDSSIDFKVGDKVVHTVFGLGYVIAKNKNEITILFSSTNQKKTLISNHKSIKRIVN